MSEENAKYNFFNNLLRLGFAFFILILMWIEKHPTAAWVIFGLLALLGGLFIYFRYFHNAKSQSKDNPRINDDYDG